MKWKFDTTLNVSSLIAIIISLSMIAGGFYDMRTRIIDTANLASTNREMLSKIAETQQSLATTIAVQQAMLKEYDRRLSRLEEPSIRGRDGGG